MKMFAKTLRSAFAFVLVAALMLGVCSSPIAFAADYFGEKTEINYVALGASNTNGFGLMGYLPDELYGNPVDKFNGSVYGYQMEPEAAYPALVANALKEMTGKPVNLEQLAISSMRAEELHVLLDNNYYGDKYTEWRFTAGQNWFNMANPGGLDGLRAEYQNFVANADVITVDIGSNNFGVYASNRIFNNMFDADFTRFDEGTQRDVALVKAEIEKVLNTYATGVLTPELEGMLNRIVDTMTYALVGFCVNFDASMERIYALNPDATVVVVNIQNLMHGLYATLPGMDEPFAFGEFYGAIVDMANTYVAAISPYADRYYYAYIGEDGQAETFLKDIQDYTGNPEDLRTAVTDCFDVYDNNMYAKTRVLQVLLREYESSVSVTPECAYSKEEILADTDAGLMKFGTAVYKNEILVAGLTVQDFLSGGAANILPDQLQDAYNLYKNALLTVYDTAATFMQLGANSTVLDLAAAAANFATAGKGILQTLFAMLIASIENPGLEIETTPEFQALANDPTAMAIITLGVRSDLGNSFFSHPNENGHVEIKDAIIAALENETRGYELVLEEVIALVTEYYDEAYAFGYEYALENGYVDAVVDALDAAIAAVEAAELDTLGLTAELKAEVAAELAEVVEALEAAKALVVEADVLDEATLNALVAALEEANDALAQVNAVLAQAGADVNNLVILPAIEAAQEYVETVVIPAVEKAVEEAIEAAKEAAKIAAEKAYEYLVEALGDAYDYLVEAIVDAVVTYMPVVDEMLYDYFYNNPEEVIEFVKTYGPYLVPVVEEYGDEALALVGYVLYTYGEDMAAYVIENSDEILAGFAAWADKYGERTAEMLQVYAEALGLCDAVREQIAELEAALEELKAELDKVTGEAKAAIEAEIAKIEAAIEELNAKVEAVIDALNNAVADANAKVEDVIADIEAAIEDLKASVEELKANVESLINETLAAIREEIFAANRAVLEEVKALAEDILNKQIENLEDLVEALEEAAVAAAKEIKAIIDELVYEATHGEYVIENDSFYVALGDSSAVSESYVDSLAAVLGVDYANLAKAGDTTTETLALIAEQAEVLAKADLVTVGYTANIFTAEVTYTMQNILMGDPVEVYDWVALVGENGAEYVEKALAEVRAKLVEEGLDIEVSGRNVADMLMACVEAYAYTYVAHVLTYPEIVNAIHEVAPEALVVIVGLHNTVENIVIDIEGTEIALGDYVQYAVDAANVISLVNAILVEDTVFVATPDVETLKEEKGDELTYDMISFVFEAILTNGADFATSKAGHAYITEQILNALTIIDNRTGLLGDADSDGDVDNVDAMLVLQYDAALIGENDLDLTVCDVNGDGLVDNVDAMLILQYDALLIEVFPVEE